VHVDAYSFGVYDKLCWLVSNEFHVTMCLVIKLHEQVIESDSGSLDAQAMDVKWKHTSFKFYPAKLQEHPLPSLM